MPTRRFLGIPLNIRTYWTITWGMVLIAAALFGALDNKTLLPFGLGVSFTVYGAFTTFHKLMQFTRAAIAYIRVSRLEKKAACEHYTLPYGILSFGHEEAEHYYRQHLRSIKSMHGQQLTIFLADGKTEANRDMQRWFDEEFPSPLGFSIELPFEYVFSDLHEVQQQYILTQIMNLAPQPRYLFVMQAKGGKRKIMYTGIAFATTLCPAIQALGFTDSDTVIDADAFEHMSQVFIRSQVGAVCGYVGILNVGKKHGGTFLSRLSADRYWRAFNFERASQSASGSVMCVSGPLGMYRVSALKQVLDAWYTSTFLGYECTFGDDRELTNKILGTGGEVWYTPFAKCKTETPTTLSRWLKQQTRWMKSANREAVNSFKQVRHVAHPLWYLYELTYTTFFSLFLLIGIVFQISLAIREVSLLPLLSLVISVSLGGLLTALVGLIVSRDINRLLAVVYGYYFMIFLLPARIVAIITVYNPSWGTSSRATLKPGTS